MGWLFGRKRDPQDANEMLRRYNESEAARLAVISDGATVAAATADASFLTVSSSSARFAIEDVFTITGRGQIVTGKASSGVFRVDDDIVILRDGVSHETTRIAGIEMFRRRADETTVGELSGLLLRDKVDVARGDVISLAASA